MSEAPALLWMDREEGEEAKAYVQRLRKEAACHGLHCGGDRLAIRLDQLDPRILPQKAAWHFRGARQDWLCDDVEAVLLAAGFSEVTIEARLLRRGQPVWEFRGLRQDFRDFVPIELEAGDEAEEGDMVLEAAVSALRTASGGGTPHVRRRNKSSLDGPSRADESSTCSATARPPAAAPTVPAVARAPSPSSAKAPVPASVPPPPPQRLRSPPMLPPPQAAGKRSSRCPGRLAVPPPPPVAPPSLAGAPLPRADRKQGDVKALPPERIAKFGAVDIAELVKKVATPKHRSRFARPKADPEGDATAAPPLEDMDIDGEAVDDGTEVGPKRRQRGYSRVVRSETCFQIGGPSRWGGGSLQCWGWGLSSIQKKRRGHRIIGQCGRASHPGWNLMSSYLNLTGITSLRTALWPPGLSSTFASRSARSAPGPDGWSCMRLVWHRI